MSDRYTEAPPGPAPGQPVRPGSPAPLVAREGFVWCLDCTVFVRAGHTDGHDRWHIERAAHADPNQAGLFGG